MFDLKTDQKLPHHYMINVAIESLRSKNPGKMFLKHGPLHFTNDDIDRVRSAAILSQDRLFETSSQQALENFGCLDLARNIRSMQLSGQANECTTHHFSSSSELDDEWFVTLVEFANTSEHNKELLRKSRVR